MCPPNSASSWVQPIYAPLRFSLLRAFRAELSKTKEIHVAGVIRSSTCQGTSVPAFLHLSVCWLLVLQIHWPKKVFLQSLARVPDSFQLHLFGFVVRNLCSSLFIGSWRVDAYHDPLVCGLDYGRFSSGTWLEDFPGLSRSIQVHHGPCMRPPSRLVWNNMVSPSCIPVFFCL